MENSASNDTPSERRIAEEATLAAQWIDTPEGTPAIPDQLMEEQLQERDVARAMVPLKNGAGRMRMAQVRGAQIELQMLLESKANVFMYLHNLLSCECADINEDQFLAMKESNLMTYGDNIRSDIKAVMLAGYYETPCGPILVEPVDVTKHEHAAIVERYDSQFLAEVDKAGPIMDIFLADLIAQSRKSVKDGGHSI